ncbi:MAG: UvrD-helicase domain-containing protein [Clostridiales bacterium]|nr:UvrD-helicase domain-containing protein [Clostridiales bacterium]
MEVLDKLLGGLNKAQLEAVKATEGYIRVIAGAGSGKTRALTRRYAWLVEGLGISPSNILCVTFTNKAANEMRNRVKNLIGADEPISLVCTYHGFCVKVLREDINKLYYPKGFSIIDEQDERILLREIYEEIEITSKTVTFSTCIDYIAARKDNPYYIKHMESFEMLDDKINKSRDLLEKIFYSYLKKQKKNYAVDFDDLLNFTLYIFINHKDILIKWQNKLHYIQVDEFQDSDPKQYMIISMISKGHGNLFVVGDPDQTIYEWRGANPEYIIDFHKNFPDVKTIIMNRNYRSTPEILNVSNSIIKNNKMRIEKDMYTKNAKGPLVTHFHGVTEEEETKWIIQKIKKLVESGAKLHDFAVLYRANFLSRAVEQALIKESLDYVVFSGVKFFDRQEIKTIIAYLKMITNGDDISFLRTVNFPRRGVGRKKISFLKLKAEENDCSLYDALKDNSRDSVMLGSACGNYIKLIEKMKHMRKAKSISELARDLLNESGFMEFYRLDGDNNRLDNIAEFMTSMITYEQTAGEDVELYEYLQELSLYTDADIGMEKDRIKLMTIHVAKGLEFPYVFLYGLTEDILPNARAMQERKLKALEEERRLAYVAVTRAKNELFLTESEGTGHGGSYKYPSRFLLEIKENMIVREGKLDPELLEKTKRRANARIQIAKSGYFTAGDEVIHPVWNEGTIIKIDTDKGEYIVKFKEPDVIRHIRMKYRLMVKKI